MIRSTILITGAAGAIAAGVLAGCGSGDDAGPAASAPTPTPAPAVSFVTPSDDGSIDGTFTAKVDLKDFTLAPDEVGMPAAEGKGHIHFSLDGGKYDQPMYSGANGKLAKQLGTAGMYSPSVAPEITYVNIPAGSHTLKVWLANNDHSDTGLSDTVTFTVK